MIRTVVLTMLVFLSSKVIASASPCSFDGSGPIVHLGKVQSSSRVHFVTYDGMRDCPNDTPSCQLRSFVVRGDLLVLAKNCGTWVWATYPNKFGGNDGWIRSDAVTDATVRHNRPAHDWVGEWIRDSSTIIDVKADGSDLILDGEATWTNAQGYPNDGALTGPAKLKDDFAYYRDPDGNCTATLHILGPYLVVYDDNECGGLNVTFSGVYRRN